jgi:hypothetical protein
MTTRPPRIIETRNSTGTKKRGYSKHGADAAAPLESVEDRIPMAEYRGDPYNVEDEEVGTRGFRKKEQFGGEENDDPFEGVEDHHEETPSLSHGSEDVGGAGIEVPDGPDVLSRHGTGDDDGLIDRSGDVRGRGMRMAGRMIWIIISFSFFSASRVSRYSKIAISSSRC